jgi:hypothetical protein
VSAIARINAKIGTWAVVLSPDYPELRSIAVLVVGITPDLSFADVIVGAHRSTSPGISKLHRRVPYTCLVDQTHLLSLPNIFQ